MVIIHLEAVPSCDAQIWTIKDDNLSLMTEPGSTL